MKRWAEKGFTLVELLIVMAIFIIVIILSSQAFERIVGSSSQEGKKAESNIQGVVGLELMRTDIEHAGYGLPWVLDTPASFPEMDSAKVPANSLADGITSTAFNDSALDGIIDTNKVPRAYQSRSGSTGTAYLVVKSVIAGFSPEAKKWAYVKYSGSGGSNSYIQKWNSSDDYATNEFLTTLNSNTRQLITNSGSSDSATNFFYSAGANVSDKMYVPSGFQPAFDSDVYLTYDVASQSLRMPYNRADFYVKTPATGLPQRCAPGTGILYKAILSHSDGGVYTPYPLLDCVADMQVVFSLDTNGDGVIDFHTADISLLSAQTIRSQVKEVRVYILTHEGKGDRSYTYPSSTIDVGESIWGNLVGRHFDLTTLPGIGTKWKNYRWKVFKMIAVPRNLSS